MGQATLAGVDLYGRHVDVNGHATYMHHRVWCKDTFVSAKTREAEMANSKQKPGEPRLAAFTQLTEDQYKMTRTK